MKKLYFAASMLIGVLFFCSFTSVDAKNTKYNTVNDQNYDMTSVYGSFVESEDSKYDADKKLWTYRHKDVIEDFQNGNLSTMESILDRN